MRVETDREVCIGSGNCVRLAPAVFDQDDDEGLVLGPAGEVAPDQQDAAADAVAQCPVGALAQVG